MPASELTDSVLTPTDAGPVQSCKYRSPSHGVDNPSDGTYATNLSVNGQNTVTESFWIEPNTTVTDASARHPLDEAFILEESNPICRW